MLKKTTVWFALTQFGFNSVDESVVATMAEQRNDEKELDDLVCGVRAGQGMAGQAMCGSPAGGSMGRQQGKA